MKSIRLVTIAFVIISALSQCSKDEVNPKDQKISQLTSGVWVTESVLNSENGDLTFQYPDFSIGFMKDMVAGYDGRYFVTDGGQAFKQAVGSWKFNEALTSVVLDNGRAMEFTLSDTSLTLVFFIAPENGRVGGVSGTFTFKLRKR